MVALYSAGVYEGKEIEKGLDYLTGFLPAEGGARRESYYFYGHYYAVQAMWQAGGKRFAKWYPAIRDDLISKQRSDGAWSSRRKHRRILDRHGLHHFADAEQLFADFSEVRDRG